MKEVMEKISELLLSNSDDLYELAKIAGVDPSILYIGVDFRQSDLSSQDISMLNLSGANFKNATLTDNQKNANRRK